MMRVRLVVALPGDDPHRAEHGPVQHRTHLNRPCTEIYILFRYHLSIMTILASWQGYYAFVFALATLLFGVFGSNIAICIYLTDE